MDKNAEPSFKCFSASWVPLWRSLCLDLYPPPCKCVFVFLISCFWSSLHILDIIPLSYPLWRLKFCLELCRSFLGLWGPLIAHLSLYANSALFRKSFPVSVSSKLSSTFSFRFIVSGLMLGSLIHLEWSIMECDNF